MNKLLELYRAIVKIHIVVQLKNGKDASKEVKKLDYITRNITFDSSSEKMFAYEFDANSFI